MNFFILFLTGLTTGGLACLALQGGLLASVVTNQKDASTSDKKIVATHNWLPVSAFLIAKLLVHTIFGFFLGLLGSRLTLSLEVRLFFQTLTAFFMFATAMNLLDAHPIFRYVVFQSPKFLQRFIRSTSKSTVVFAPIILGILTLVVPCGVTQAMEVLAISSGSPITGALIMFFFVLGTFPLFATLGVAATKLSQSAYQKFYRISAVLLLGMALYSINGVMVVLNSPVTLQKLVSPVRYFFSAERFTRAGSVVQVKNGVQQIKISINPNGYAPQYVQVKQNIPVELVLESKDTYSCALTFVLKEFGINAVLKPTDKQVFNFIPNRPGKFTFTCSMGMYSGVLEVL